ncbi:histidine kinase [Calothrix sp. NIES-4071]|nr:histidine kinase [Calothrix sp. NIES-4071]BAZ55677.1 histidine kinase [Calothrix sp. NIES-4105]
MSRILLLLDNKKNRRLFLRYLVQSHEIVAPDGLSGKELEKLIQQPFDLCILCSVMLKRYRQVLHARKETEYPVVLPYLLVIGRQHVGMINCNMQHSIDELITIPVEKRELQIRVEVLLRSRVLSQHMHTTNRKLLMEIEQRRCLEADIRSSLEREREMNELKSRFVSMVSHEFRSPLQVILSSSQIIEQYGSQLSLEKRQQFFQHIKANVKKMNKLLNDVLTIGEIDFKRFKPDIKPINLADFSHDLIEEICLTSGQHHKISFKFYSNYNYVYVDENLIRYILTNLLSNAVKYSSPQHIINFTLRCQDDEAIFTIQDKGIGIPPEDKAKLFGLFQRASNAKNIPGTGLGLAIVKKCVDLYAGSIELQSEVGAGTTITVKLPIPQPALIVDRRH